MAKLKLSIYIYIYIYFSLNKNTKHCHNMNEMLQNQLMVTWIAPKSCKGLFPFSFPEKNCIQKLMKQKMLKISGNVEKES